jgi:MbtH protein
MIARPNCGCFMTRGDHDRRLIRIALEPFASFKVHQQPLCLSDSGVMIRNIETKKFHEIFTEPLLGRTIGMLGKIAQANSPGTLRAETINHSGHTPAVLETQALRMIDMTDRSESNEAIYVVVMNGEEQYSIWPDDKRIPDGWRAVGTRGAKAECLQYIEETWTDMRPLSLRKRMAERTGPDR